jgi:hypothetical protein
MHIDTGHLDELLMRLAREEGRLAEAKTAREASFRRAQISACKREIAGERLFLGLPDEPEMTDEELLAALDA